MIDINTIDTNLKFFNIILEKVDNVIDKEKYNYSFNVSCTCENVLILLLYPKNKIIMPTFILKIQKLSTALNFEVRKNNNKENKSCSTIFQLDFENKETNSINKELLEKALYRLQTFFKITDR